jgi:hypothetical protein
MSPEAQNKKTGPDAHYTVKKESQGRKTRKRDPTPSVPPKMSPSAQNMKTGPDALGSAENNSGRAKHENGYRRPRYRRK